ncbi:hypothetical protein MFIFM68171_00404 [Madurella fahalii]|uniref:DUF4160 domain-containing protein n=1 Tax=Madurella fahalii TaxID=1157608 RepID=A0ABQ0FXI8_9PEZI
MSTTIRRMRTKRKATSPAWDRTSCSGCGETSPKDHKPLVVEALEKPYVTVHDFVTAVHQWLIAHREEILQARSLGEDTPATPNANLVVVAI